MKDMYETLRRESDFEHKPPPGLMFHVVSFEKSGNTMHAVEIWESEEQLNNMISNHPYVGQKKGGAGFLIQAKPNVIA